jgi:hypothetical protein
MARRRGPAQTLMCSRLSADDVGYRKMRRALEKLGEARLEVPSEAAEPVEEVEHGRVAHSSQVLA